MDPDPWKLEIYVGVGDDCKVAEVMHDLTDAELLEEIHTALEIPVVTGLGISAEPEPPPAERGSHL